MMTAGVTTARLTILRNRWVAGTLHPGIAAVLDGIHPGWREDPAAEMWSETFADLTEWVTDNGRLPNHDDDNAAGLRAWFDMQDPATLADDQLRKLETIPGWLGNLHDPDAKHLYSLLAGLRAAGVKPVRSIDRHTSEVILNAFQGPSAPVPPIEPRWGSPLFTYLLFVARRLRQPGVNEPGGRWIRRVRATGAPAAVLAVLEQVPGWDGADAIAPELTAGAARYTEFVNRNGRAPRRNGKWVGERSLAAWARRRAATPPANPAEAELITTLFNPESSR